MAGKTPGIDLYDEPQPGKAVQRFNELVDHFYDTTFARFPEYGSGAGRHEFDAQLSRPTPRLFEQHGKLVERTLHAIEDLPLQEFDGSDLLARRAMLASLRMDQLNTVDLRRWENNPQEHVMGAADAVYSLIVRHADDLSPVADAVMARLKAVPKYLAGAAQCIRKPDPLWKSLALRAAPGTAGMFTSLAAPLIAAGKSKATVNRAIANATAALDEYVAVLKKSRPAAAGSYAIGEDRFQRLMVERLGVNWSPREALAMARRLAAEIKAAMDKEARRFDPKKPAREILDAAATQWQPETGDLLTAYEACVKRMRRSFESAGMMTFPRGDRLLVKPVPAFMRDQFPTAAYSSPGPLDPDQTGIFWVNDLTTPEMTPAQRQAEIAQHFGLELTAAHEAYPGHHLQFVIQNKIPSLARRMAHHAVYYEGWTLWCEQMTVDLLAGDKDANPYLRLQQLADALWRAWRIVVDVGLHCGTLTYDQACEVLMREVGFTRARAQGDVNWYTAAPTVPMSYLLGRQELLRLKRKRVDSGAMSLREFNDWVLSFGAVPWRWIEECAFA